MTDKLEIGTEMPAAIRGGGNAEAMVEQFKSDLYNWIDGYSLDKGSGSG